MTATDVRRTGDSLRHAGTLIMRYGLVVVLLWIGALKFTAYEAHNIQPLVTNSPLFSWAAAALGERGIARVIGVIEIAAGVLIAARSFQPVLCVIGSLIACGMFLTTLSFVLTTPGVWEPGYGFPFPSGSPGQFLAKDLLLLGIALWSAGEALAARDTRTAPA